MWPIHEKAIGPEHICKELGELIERPTSLIRGDSTITLFKSVGSAIEDVATASLALQRAVELAIGSRISM